MKDCLLCDCGFTMKDLFYQGSGSQQFVSVAMRTPASPRCCTDNTVDGGVAIIHAGPPPPNASPHSDALIVKVYTTVSRAIHSEELSSFQVCSSATSQWEPQVEGERAGLGMSYEVSPKSKRVDRSA